MKRLALETTKVPPILYGTAWKEERTEELVRLALTAGFRGFDTANQRKHYFEAGVGAAIARSGVERDELFLQTKFTYARGQDQRLPYDPRAPISRQVEQSFQSSLEHLGTKWVDSLVLHGPWSNRGWSREDREAWAAITSFQREQRVRFIGISNVSLEQLTTLCEQEAAPPAFVQNRCYARSGWDREVRDYCRTNGIVYQGFSLLTANHQELAAPPITDIAQRLHIQVPDLVFRFARAIGILPLSGTTNPAHMREDLAAVSATLDAADVATILRER